MVRNMSYYELLKEVNPAMAEEIKESVPEVETIPEEASAPRKRAKNWKYRQGHKVCEGCQCAPSVDTHHVVPLAKGGCDEDSNLIALCLDCHAAMHPELPKSFFEEANRVNFSHRRDTAETLVIATSAQTES